MKHFLLCLALGAGLLSGCSDSQTVQTAAGLSGTYDLTAVGDFVFVTSADRNELRVLDLNASPRDWVRAPNPLEPLSIPVLKRPLYLSRDLRYEADGSEATGPYVYARSAGTDEISVVAADPAYFKEIKRLSGLGYVTAFAARGAPEGGTSVLYFATQDETGSRLFRMELPGPEALLAMEAQPEARPIPLAAPLTDEAVAALLVLPAPEGQERLVVATRKTSPTAARGDRTFLLDPNSGAELLEYKFGGPVRILATHPAVSNLVLDRTDTEETCDFDGTVPPKVQRDPNNPARLLDTPLAAGTYVFGVLDESVCTQRDQESCSGILAVEASTGELAVDSTNVPMLPIRVGQALPTGLTLAADAEVLMNCRGTSGVQRRPLVGIVPASDGRINLFDAAKLRPFDINVYTESSTGTVITTGTAGQTGEAIVDINGTAKTTSRPDLKSYINLSVLEGATRDDTFRVLYEGSLQGLANRPFVTEGQERTVECTENPAGCTFFVDAEAVAERSGGELPMVRVGDLISLINGDGPCVEEELRVLGAEVRTLPDRPQPVGVLTTGPVPASCPSPTRFTVRASAQYPLVVYSDAKGYVGRMMVQGDPLPIPGGFFWHPEGFANQAEFRSVSAYLNLANLGDLSLARGDQLIVTAQSGFLPYAADVDTTTSSGSAAGLTSFRLPGPVVHKRVNGLDFAYIAYPSADGILQVSLSSLVDNTANIRGMLPFQ